MTPAEAIELLTGDEHSPSTVHLLALEALERGVEWLDDAATDEVVAEIVALYVPAFKPGVPHPLDMFGGFS